MLTWEDDVQAHALRQRGWSITAIARHLGRDRKTIRAYLTGERIPGQRRSAGADPFDDIERYVAARFVDDAHVAASALYDEVTALGYPRSYPTFTRQLRVRGLRPVCGACATVADRATIDLVHEPGDEVQWDWLELPQAPWLPAGELLQLLVGTSPWSSRCRAVLSDATDQPHLIAALDGVVRRFGGVTRAWRFDRMSTVVAIGSDRLLPSFAEVAKHYGVEVRICPAYRANRKGAVEKSNHFIAQRWWRTADVATKGEAQASLDAFLSGTGDARIRHVDGRRTTVGALAEAEPLRAVPARAFPAVVRVSVTVARDATVAFEGNRYGVPPSVIGQPVVVRHRLGSTTIEIAVGGGLVVAAHERAAPGGHAIVRSDAQRVALERVVLAAAGSAGGRPCHRKPHRPPGQAAAAEAARLRARTGGDDEVVIDLAAYARLVDDRTGDSETDGDGGRS